MPFQRLNTLLGWAVFALSATVYLLTLEPTASFWDCGEFIACANKLEVPHPPGAPFFLLVGRIFSLFASGPETVAYMVNTVSALSSAGTILFLFWTITLLSRKLMGYSYGETPEGGKAWAILGAGLVGSLAFTFTDSFWFSAVEAEVYAMSSFFTALVFWAILKWEQVADEEGADRWLVFIAYMVGLSIGVHLLNLLAIPAIGLVFYFRRKPDAAWLRIVGQLTFIGTMIALAVFVIGTMLSLGAHSGSGGSVFRLAGYLAVLLVLGMGIYWVYTANKKGEVNWKGVYGAFGTLAVSAVILLLIMSGIITGLPSIANVFEIQGVNSFGLPRNTGVIVFIVLLIGGIVFGIRYAKKKGKSILHLALHCLVFVLIGYSSYAIIVIRSNYDPPIDENDPENAIKFVSYLKREQYGDRPLLLGPQFTAQVDPRQDYVDGAPQWRWNEETGEYEIYDYKLTIEANSPQAQEHQAFLPRMYSRQGRHVQLYEQLLEQYSGGKYRKGEKPSGKENLTYMFDRQMAFYYWRYFGWNFVGRQTDVETYGVLLFGPQKAPAPFLESEARNRYFALPLVLGLLGLFFQLRRNRNDFSVVFAMFFLTGVGVILYLNQPPIEPRERDYAFAGSYYTFSIWLGMGVLGLYSLGEKLIKSSMTRAIAATGLSLLIPAILVAQNWDDHDRSKRWHSVDSAKNLLSSCAPNAILFTGGDNDTFPLWYVQEVEGFRTDVRVCNLSLLNTDWYITQMKQQAYESAPLPISLEERNYISGTNDQLYYSDPTQQNRPMNLKIFIDQIHNENVDRRISLQTTGMGKNYAYAFPSNNFFIDFNREATLEQGFIPDSLQPRMVDKLQWTFNRGYMEKKDLIMLDMIVNIAEDDWKRPIYFSTTLGPSSYLDLQPYMVQEGLAYRLMPVKGRSNFELINTEVMYTNLMERMSLRGLQDGSVFFDENYKRFPFNLRGQYLTLATTLFNQGDKARALKVIDYCFEQIPHEGMPYDYFSAQFIPLLNKMGQKERAQDIADIVVADARADLVYLKAKRKSSESYEQQRACQMIYIVSLAYQEEGRTAEAEDLVSFLQTHGCFRGQGQ